MKKGLNPFAGFPFISKYARWLDGLIRFGDTIDWDIKFARGTPDRWLHRWHLPSISWKAQYLRNFIYLQIWAIYMYFVMIQAIQFWVHLEFRLEWRAIPTIQRPYKSYYHRYNIIPDHDPYILFSLVLRHNSATPDHVHAPLHQIHIKLVLRSTSSTNIYCCSLWLRTFSRKDTYHGTPSPTLNFLLVVRPNKIH